LVIPQIYQLNVTSITANWQAFSSGSGANTAQGYQLQASTAADFTGTIYSSATTNVALSTLTVINLTPNTLYYFRAGGVNWNNVYNYSFIGSSATTAGAAVTNPVISSVFITSITTNWTGAANVTGYDVEAS